MADKRLNCTYRTLEEVFCAIKDHEIQSTTTFVSGTTVKDFGKHSLDSIANKKIYWYNSKPYINLGNKVMYCHHGKDHHRRRKERLEASKPLDQKPRNKSCKKLDCPAQIIIKEIVLFPLFKASTEKKSVKDRVSRELRESWARGDLIQEKLFLVGTRYEHKNHAIGKAAEISQPVHRDIIKKIHEMVDEGVRDMDEMRRHIKFFVPQLTQSVPSVTNRRFYPSMKTIKNHMYLASKKDETSISDQDKLREFMHPSVQVEGTEADYIPVQCFDPVCAYETPHMHCPFCVKTKSYTDPAILKAHYRVEHVDKGIEFAGMQVLRCCDQCDIFGVKKGEKKMKEAHWHCYKCRNGFNRRHEAITHYKNHLRNPQKTFPIHNSQDIYQPVTQATEAKKAAACISTDSFSVHDSITEGAAAHSSGISMLSRGVGAVETVGISDTQTVMVIQDDGQGNFSTVQELGTIQDLDPPDHTIFDETEDTSQDTIQELRDKIAQLEKEKAVQKAHIDLLSKKIEEQAEQIASYKLKEQSLLKQMQELQQGMSVPRDKAMQDLCNQLETQHREFIRKQITQLKHSLVQTSVPQPKMTVLNTNALSTQLGQTVNLQAFHTYATNATQVAVSSDVNHSAGLNEVSSGSLKTEVTEVDTNNCVEEGKVTDETNSQRRNTMKKKLIILEIHNLPQQLDGNIFDEPKEK
ncbi:uncharacterized protein LOC123534198 isoform X2 [Mercenaria mercenaria]|uniref:uncharacterized protein LOC123534198 isoform X2 n=1 Tax=Mercenaria mercenaria TaxID=6596 RepID=UPI00234F7CFA|nr:uncharacterized protein LOC123534198 isoform X2 [Mercenaria mercenaria]